MAIERRNIRWNGWGWAAQKDTVGAREEVWNWLARQLGMPSLLATPPRPLEEISLPPSRLGAAERAQFVSLLGAGRVRDGAYERAFHAHGRSYHDLLRLRAGDLSAAPDVVLYPRAAQEVVSLLAIANESGIAIIPYGGGTSVVGGVSGGAKGFDCAVTLDLSGMDRIADIDANAGMARAEAGVYGVALERALQAKGMTLGHYPQSFEFSTLGGWIAHSGSGQLSNRYGGAADWLLSARAVTPKGVLSSDTFSVSATGPRLVDLLLGSEGALGIVTDATFRIRPLPKASDYRGFLFRDFASGTAAIRRAVQEEIPVAMLRLSDSDETAFFRAYAEIGKKKTFAQRIGEFYYDMRGIETNGCLLIAGFEGTASRVEAARRAFSDIAHQLGALDLGRRPGERWRASRFHGPYMRDPMLDRGVGVDTLETAANWAMLGALHVSVRGAIENAIRETAPHPAARGVVMCHISHSYTEGASLYFTYIFPRALDREIAQWQAIKNAATEAILANGGTISHHHGVGEDHLPWIAQEKGELGIEILRAIKRTVDPKGILNPGKLLPS